MIGRVNRDDQLKAWWHVANVNAVARMQINDHSWVHIQIVTNIALKLLRQLTKHGIEPAMVTDYGMTPEDAEVVVALDRAHALQSACRCTATATRTSASSSPSRSCASCSTGIYEEPERTVIVSEVLQGIISHRADGEPLTLEAGILRVADALDMEQGRSRIPFERGRVGDPLALGRRDRGRLDRRRREQPIRIEIAMNNSSGIYQVDGLLKAKLRGSGLEPYVEVVAHIDTEAEKRLVPLYRLEI